MTLGGRVGALWIGGLESYMDEEFLQTAVNMMGEAGVVSIKVMTNKFTGQPAGYGFINFDCDQTAIIAMHRLGGKMIPNSNPPVRFKLNHNSTRLQPGESDTSIWVGDLTPEVDDFALFRFFTQRYATIRCAKVVLDDSGFSKGYGFVRFGSATEQQHALGSMTGEMGLGSKPIKVSIANQKTRVESGGILSPSSSWGRISSWPTLSNEISSASIWHSEASAHVGGSTWGTTGLGAGLSGQSADGSLIPPPAATSPGPGLDLNVYHQYYQQIAQQQQQYAAAWSAWQQAQQQP